MIELNKKRVCDFVDATYWTQIAENRGCEKLLEAFDNDELNDDNFAQYVLNAAKDDPQHFGQRISEILKIDTDIQNAISLIGDATMILMNYNRRFDNSAASAIDEFFSNTTHNPNCMFVELIEDTLK
jgi:hypothetical protein